MGRKPPESLRERSQCCQGPGRESRPYKIRNHLQGPAETSKSSLAKKKKRLLHDQHLEQSYISSISGWTNTSESPRPSGSIVALGESGPTISVNCSATLSNLGRCSGSLRQHSCMSCTQARLWVPLMGGRAPATTEGGWQQQVSKASHSMQVRAVVYHDAEGGEQQRKKNKSHK